MQEKNITLDKIKAAIEALNAVIVDERVSLSSRTVTKLNSHKRYLYNLSLGYDDSWGVKADGNDNN